MRTRNNTTNNIKDKYQVGDTSCSVIKKANEKHTRLCTNYFYII